MTTRTPKSVTLLALPLALLTACGDELEGPNEGLEGIDSEHFELHSLELTGLNSPHLLHPIQVAVSGEVSASAYTTNINVGMRTLDGGAGCVLGAMAIDPPAGETEPLLAEGEREPWFHEAEFIVNHSCAGLVGREDVELFVAFDPWNELGGSSYLETVSTNPAIYPVVAAAALSVEGCASCETTYAVEDTPGLDTELREVNISSVVAVVPIAGPSGVEPVETSSRPDFSLTLGSRVVGLDRAQELADGLVHHSHRIRPLGSNDAGLPLVEVEDGQYVERGEISVPGPATVNTVASLYIEGAAHDAVVDGAWSNIDEFELLTCLESGFEQAVFTGEEGARDNDCAALPVVIARQEVGPDGLPLPDADAGAATNGKASAYSDAWGGSAGYGFGYSGVSFDAWFENQSTDEPTSTYGGIPIHGPGSWFEAGVRSYATVFSSFSLAIVDIYGTFIGYDAGGGGAAMGATILGRTFVEPFEIQLYDGVFIGLQDMFDYAGLDIDPTLGFTYPLLGKSFDDGCDDVGAGVWLDVSVGIDTGQTGVAVTSIPDGVKIDGVFAPFFDLSVGAGASSGSFLGASVGITATLTLLNLTLPFQTTVEVMDFGDAFRIKLGQSAGADFNTLSGKIKFKLSYGALFNNQTHNHTIAQWNGFDAYLQFFNLTQTIQNGAGNVPSNWCIGQYDSAFFGDFDGDGSTDRMCSNANGTASISDAGGQQWFSISTCAGGRMTVGDFNGDGRTDMFCTGLNSNFSWSRLTGANGQPGPSQSQSGWWCIGADDTLSSADYNGDGRDDLHCSRPSDGYVWIDYADANGNFGGTDIHGVFNGNWCDGANDVPFYGDFDADGASDRLCQNPASGAVDIEYGDGGSWSDGFLCQSRLSVGDFNGDGRTDMYCTGDANRWVMLTSSNGLPSGSKWNATGAWCNGSDQVLTTGDYNDDGRDDLYCRRPSDSYVWIDYANSSAQFNGTDWEGPVITTVSNVKLQAQWDPSKCLDILGTNPSSNNTTAQLGSCSTAESWNFSNGGKLRAGWDPTMCLDIAGTNSGSNGTNAQIYSCNSVTEQFELRDDGKLHAVWNSNMCLDIGGANSTTIGTNAAIHNCNSVTETWKFVSSAASEVISEHLEEDVQLEITRHGKCIDLAGGQTSNGSNIQQWSCVDGHPNMTWEFKQKKNHFRIRHVASGKCLQASGSSNGSNVELHGCDNGDNQRFTLLDNYMTSDHDFKLQAKNSGKCIDLSAGSSANGANIQVWSCSDTNANQNFKLR